MKVRAVVLAITSTLLVAGCTTPPVQQGGGARIYKRPQACQATGNCDVPVTLVSCGFFTMCPSVPDVILVPKDGNGQHRAVTVVWSAPNGYTFTDQGIVFDEPPNGLTCMKIANGATPIPELIA